jgi:hypothetical protein
MAPMSKNIKDLDRTSLRLSAETFALIDKARARRVGNVSRNTWIAEAIQEKLTRELAEAMRKEGSHAHVL